MIFAQLLGTGHTPYRNAIDVATVRAKIYLIAPDLVAVDVRVNVPRDAMCVIHIDTPKVLQLHKRLKYGALFQDRAHIIKPLFAVVKADRLCEVVVRHNSGDPLFPGGEVFRRFAVKPFGEIIFYCIRHVLTSRTSRLFQRLDCE